MTKRIVVLLLVTLLSFALMTACGNREDGEGEAEAGVTSGTDTAADETLPENTSAVTRETGDTAGTSAGEAGETTLPGTDVTDPSSDSEDQDSGWITGWY